MNCSPKNLILCFIIFVCGISTNSVVADPWRLLIHNKTKYPAHLLVKWHACKEDRPIIQPNKKIVVPAKNCLVSYIEGALVTVDGDSSKNIPVQRWDPTGGVRNFRADIVQFPNGTYGIKADFK